jgi:hypothetical protein
MSLKILVIGKIELTDGYLDHKINETLERCISTRVMPHNRKIIKGMMFPQCAWLKDSFYLLIATFQLNNILKPYIPRQKLPAVDLQFIDDYSEAIKHYKHSSELCKMIGTTWLVIIRELQKSAKESEDFETANFFRDLYQELNSIYRQHYRYRTKEETVRQILSRN